MAVLTVQTLSLSGTELTNNAASAGGDTFANDGRTYIKLNNGDASPTTATFITPQIITTASLAVADLPIVITNAKEEIIGPFPTATFGTNVSITYSSVTSLTVDAFKLAS